ncbi:MAG TPA: DUF6776 family protein [Gammaproteobacteria bacterium]
MKLRSMLLIGLAAVLIPAASYLLFELGRYEAGYSLLDRRREVEEHRRVTAEQARTIDELKRQIAILETSRDIDRETAAQLEDTLMELEAKLQAQEEELAFYRGIISPPDGVAGLRIQSLEVVPEHGEQRYTLRLVLMQAIVQNRRVAGVVRLRLTGARDGEELELSLEDVAADENVTELPFGFRYFQGLEQELELPEGFEPATIEVEVRPTEPRGEPLTRTFEWAEVGGDSLEE